MSIAYQRQEELNSYTFAILYSYLAVQRCATSPQRIRPALTKHSTDSCQQTQL